MLRVLPVALAHLFFFTVLSAQTTIYVVRHADRAPGNEDPPISETGQLRAKALARLLTDAPLGAIFATEAVRTQQTAAHTASAHRLHTETVTAKDIAGLLRRIKAELPPGKSALVVGHRATVPLIVQALGGGAIPPLGSSEVDRMTAVTCWPDGKCAVQVFRYGPE
ncbi:SixA phosphatase family protein [Paludibaculum fermentans]|uniref:Histidine phosphatase family protein n=1 Tax=Paludibaculum fermentans TaxID=1473598 RepID=A0A7S7NKX9_PALFE|nr:histidine phosphatase family protein [Paludibaculum fermentans]QOY85483.1 histidine phosphatase family protein [Paludibaculum fermentans]